jgi:hypothetical protein
VAEGREGLRVCPPRACLVARSVDAVSSRYQWTPAVFAPGVSVSGMISSTAAASVANSAGVKLRGVVPLAMGRSDQARPRRAATRAEPVDDCPWSGGEPSTPAGAAAAVRASPSSFRVSRRPKRFAGPANSSRSRFRSSMCRLASAAGVSVPEAQSIDSSVTAVKRHARSGSGAPASGEAL